MGCFGLLSRHTLGIRDRFANQRCPCGFHGEGGDEYHLCRGCGQHADGPVCSRCGLPFREGKSLGDGRRICAGCDAGLVYERSAALRYVGRARDELERIETCTHSQYGGGYRYMKSRSGGDSWQHLVDWTQRTDLSALPDRP